MVMKQHIEEIARLTLLLCDKLGVDKGDVIEHLQTLNYESEVEDNVPLTDENIEDMKEVGTYIPDFLNNDIEVLGLFPRTRNALYASGIDTLGILLKMSKSDISKIPFMGTSSMRNLKACLDLSGFVLSPETLHEQKAKKFCLNPYVRSQVAKLVAPLNYKLSDLQYFSDSRIDDLLKRGRISKDNRKDFISWVRGGCQ